MCAAASSVSVCMYTVNGCVLNIYYAYMNLKEPFEDNMNTLITYCAV